MSKCLGSFIIEGVYSHMLHINIVNYHVTITIIILAWPKCLFRFFCKNLINIISLYSLILCECSVQSVVTHIFQYSADIS